MPMGLTFLSQQMADLNKIIEDDDDALADRLFIIDKMFTYHSRDQV